MCLILNAIQNPSQRLRLSRLVSFKMRQIFFKKKTIIKAFYYAFFVPVIGFSVVGIVVSVEVACSEVTIAVVSVVVEISVVVSVVVGISVVVSVVVGMSVVISVVGMSVVISVVVVMSVVVGVSVTSADVVESSGVVVEESVVVILVVVILVVVILVVTLVVVVSSVINAGGINKAKWDLLPDDSF